MAAKGYKEKHDLVMVDSSYESHNGDQLQKEAYGNHAADDVDAGDDAKAFAPCCYNNQQETHQLRDKQQANQKHVTMVQNKTMIEITLYCPTHMKRIHNIFYFHNVTL